MPSARDFPRDRGRRPPSSALPDAPGPPAETPRAPEPRPLRPPPEVRRRVRALRPRGPRPGLRAAPNPGPGDAAAQRHVATTSPPDPHQRATPRAADDCRRARDAVPPPYPYPVVAVPRPRPSGALLVSVGPIASPSSPPPLVSTTSGKVRAYRFLSTKRGLRRCSATYRWKDTHLLSSTGRTFGPRMSDRPVPGRTSGLDRRVER